MAKPRIYLAGPIPTQEEWRKIVKEELSDLDFHFFDPEEIESEEYNVVNTDLALIRRSDLVLANVTRWSTGTPMEIVYACMDRVPVLLICPYDLLSPWHEHHATRIVGTLGEAIKLLKEGWLSEIS